MSRCQDKYTTLLDLARQAKIISGNTACFDGKIQAGIPFSGYPTGVDLSTVVNLGVISQQDAVFSSSTTTTIFDVSNSASTTYDPIFDPYSGDTWSNPLFSANTVSLNLPITTLSAETQSVGPFWTLTQTGMTGDHVIGLQYTGYTIQYGFFSVSPFGLGYSGFTTAQQINYSAGTLDYKGPLDYIHSKEDATIENKLTTKKIKITGGASASTIGYVLTQIDAEGNAEWAYNASATTYTYWTSGSTGNYSLKTINDSTVDATGDYAIASGFNNLAGGNYSSAGGSASTTTGISSFIHSTNSEIDNGTDSIIIGGENNYIDRADKAGIFVGENNTINKGSNNTVIVNGVNHTIIDISPNSSIIGGDTNEIEQNTNSSLIGGSGNTVSIGTFNNIIGGYDGTIENSYNSNMIGLSKNSQITRIRDSYNSSIISGEDHQIDYGYNSVIIGGQDSDLKGAGSEDAVTDSSIIGGNINSIIGENARSSIIGGSENSIDNYNDNAIVATTGGTLYLSYRSGIFGGRDHTLSNSTDSHIFSGENNLIDESNISSVLGGENNEIYNTYAAAIIGGDYGLISGTSNTLGLFGSAGSTIIGGIGAGVNKSILESYGATIIGGLRSRIEDNNFGSIVGTQTGQMVNTWKSQMFPSTADNNFIAGGVELLIDGGSNDSIVGGRSNLIRYDSTYSGLSASNFIGGGENNTIEGHTNSAILSGKYNYIGFDDISNNAIIAGIYNSINGGGYDGIFVGSGNTIQGDIFLTADYSNTIIGGVGNTIYTGVSSSIIGGEFNELKNNTTTYIENSIILGGQNITGTTNDTVYVPNFNINYEPDQDDSLTQILVRDTDGTVKYRSVETINYFTGNTSGDCITDLYVTNIYGCSPLHIEPSGENDVYIVENGGNVGIGTSTPIEKLDVRGNMLVSNPTGAAKLTLSGGSVGDSVIDFDNIGVSTPYARIEGNTFGGGIAGNLEFYTYPSGGPLTKRVIFANNGNVGIGVPTNNDIEKLLHVEGGDLLVNHTYGKIFTELNNPSPNDTTLTLSGVSSQLTEFRVLSPNAGGFSFGIRGETASFPTYGKITDAYIYSSNLNNGINIISRPSTPTQITDDYIRFYAGIDAASTSQLHIQGSGTTKGNIGINNESPEELLHVKDGSIRIEGVNESLFVDDLVSVGGANLGTNVDGKLIDIPSDSRVKTNIAQLKDIVDPIEFINNVTGYQFEWTDSSRIGPTGQKYYGFKVDDFRDNLIRPASLVAGSTPSLTPSQENCNTIAKTMVRKTKTKFKENHTTPEEQMDTINYVDLVPFMVEAIKDLSQGITSLNNNIINTTKKYVITTQLDKDKDNVITHNLNEEDVIVQLRDSETGDMIIPKKVFDYQTNTVKIQISETKNYKIIIIG